MLHDIFTQARRATARGVDRTRWIDLDKARRNPWLRWRPERPASTHVLTVADMAECRCPDFCNRDHGND